MQTLKVSIAMTTFNGEAYVLEQLKSIYSQSLRPNEVVICDDGSTDNTVRIIREFIQINSLGDSWNLYVNEKNKGYVKNFISAAGKTSGDVVFYSDQDDVWHWQKLEKMMAKFEENKEVRALACSLTVTDSNGNKNNTLLNKIRMGKRGNFYRVSLTSQVRNNYSVGLTLAIRRSELEWINDLIMKNDLSHDVPVGLLLSATGGYFRLCEPLVYRRVHNSNISEPKYSLKSRLRDVSLHIEGRRVYLKTLTVCYQYFKKNQLLTSREARNIQRTIMDVEKYILLLEKRKRLKLFLNIFTVNPMDNKLLKIANFVCAVFGNYHS